MFWARYEGSSPGCRRTCAMMSGPGVPQTWHEYPSRAKAADRARSM